MAKSKKHQKPTPLTPEERAARKAARDQAAEASKQAEEAEQDARVEAETKEEANEEAARELPPLPKKQRRKRTGKEIAVIVVSVIMVVSILLPSFSQIFATGGSGSTAPASYEEAASTYGPQVEERRADLEKHPDDQAAMLRLANAYYEWGIYATSYASGDDETAKASELLKNAEATYTDYLDAVGSLDSDDTRGAAINRAYCYYYEGEKDKATELLADLANETNSATVWANLGMMYEKNGDTSQAEAAYQKAIDEAGSSEADQSVRSYSESQLKNLRANAQASSGGAAGLASKLDGTAGTTK